MSEELRELVERSRRETSWSWLHLSTWKSRVRPVGLCGERVPGRGVQRMGSVTIRLWGQVGSWDRTASGDGGSCWWNLEIKTGPNQIGQNQLEQHKEFKLVCDLEPSCCSWAVLSRCSINIRSCFIDRFEGYNMCWFQLLKCPFRTFISTNEFNYFKYRSKILHRGKYTIYSGTINETLTYPPWLKMKA